MLLLVHPCSRTKARYLIESLDHWQIWNPEREPCMKLTRILAVVCSEHDT